MQKNKKHTIKLHSFSGALLGLLLVPFVYTQMHAPSEVPVKANRAASGELAVVAQMKKKSVKKEAEESGSTLDDVVLSESFQTAVPIETVTVQSVDNALGTVLFFPQYHKSPGTDVSDEKNTRALAVQKESYSIMSALFETTIDDAGTVFMVEGEQSGLVDAQERTAAQTRIDRRDAFADALRAVTSTMVAAVQETQFVDTAKENLALADRHIYLDGAAMKLWAEDAPVLLVGSEEPATQEKSRKIVRERIYLQDQMRRVRGDGSLALQQILGASIDIEDLYRLMQKNRENNTTRATSFDHMLAQSRQRAVDLDDAAHIAAIDALTRAWDALQKPIVSDMGGKKGGRAPSRDDNPFSHIRNKQQLDRLMDENEAALNTVIVDQRNRETAENMRAAMQQHNEDVAILQFGAAHEKGLVQELNNVGLTVITVMPETVAQLNAQK